VQLAAHDLAHDSHQGSQSALIPLAPNQRIIWKADNYDNIVEPWEEHIAPTLLPE
jgi:hypothetical protein